MLQSREPLWVLRRTFSSKSVSEPDGHGGAAVWPGAGQTKVKMRTRANGGRGDALPWRMSPHLACKHHMREGIRTTVRVVRTNMNDIGRELYYGIIRFSNKTLCNLMNGPRGGRAKKVNDKGF